jgi:hypothetical protein
MKPLPHGSVENKQVQVRGSSAKNHSAEKS